MLTTQLKFALRSLGKYKLYSLVNLLGLTLGLTAALVLGLFVYDELSFDRYHSQADQIHQLILHRDMPGQATRRFATGPAPVGEELVRQFPEIEASTLMTTLGRGDFSYQNNGYYEVVYSVEPAFFDFFDIEFLQGDPQSALANANNVVMTRSTAVKYFGNEDPIGKVLTGNRGEFIVSAVVADQPANSHLQFNTLFSLSQLTLFNPAWQSNWASLGQIGFYTYLKLNTASSTDLENRISSHLQTRTPLVEPETYSASLLPLTDIHFQSAGIEAQNNASPGNFAAVRALAAIAVFLLVIACINYTNLATARAINRAHEISLRKILGARRGQLTLQFLAEAQVLTVIALLLALSISQMLMPLVNGLTGKTLTLATLLQQQMLLLSIATVIAVGIAAGAYPALYLSNAAVARGLKDSHDSIASAGALRKLLVVAQFALSIVLVFCTLVVINQMRYIQTKPLGFDKSNVVAVDINSGPARADYQSIRAEFASHPNVLSVSVSSRLPGDWKPIGSVIANMPGRPAEESQQVSFIGIDENFLSTFDIDLLQGRKFEASSLTSNILVNEALVRQMDWSDPVGQSLFVFPDGAAADTGTEVTVAGVVDDFHYQSLHATIGPMILFHYQLLATVQPIDYYSIRITGENREETIAHLQNVMRLHDPVTPFEYHFLDSQIDIFYSSDRMTATLFSVAAVVAIFIACMGLFGLSSFATQQRSKEIGIRKVLGATIANIVRLLSADFMKPVLLAIVIGLPLGYYLMSQWLQSFAYAGGIGVTVFVFSALLALIVSMATVSLHSLRAAMRNPVESISYE
ncbi:MAG: ABC transporter permease [Pseudohongiellaceae bacterium]